MQRNLSIDIGNTRTKIALFEENELVQKEVWEILDMDRLRELSYNQKVKKVILSSVAKVPTAVEDFFMTQFYYLHLSAQTPLPIGLQYLTPDTLGKDRVAAAVGAQHIYPGENCLVIDAGTCITMDMVDRNGVFLGGNISPGIEMRLKAMHHFTARLPLVKQADIGGHLKENPLGNSTENAIRLGGELGALLETEGFIKLMEKRFQHLIVILTGGDTDFFVKNIKTKIFAHPNLVLIGLNQILQYNAKLTDGF
ncbi:MAG: type III pantothenate kinase [Saprospiraceae bacterium]